MNGKSFDLVTFKAEVAKVEGGIQLATATPEQLNTLREIGKKQFSNYFFQKNDQIIFPSWKDEVIKVRTMTTSNGKTVLALDVAAWCKTYGTFFFPMSILRRQPIDEQVEGVNELDYFLRENPLGASMLVPDKGDDQRLREILDDDKETILEVAEVLKFHKYHTWWSKEEKRVMTDKSVLDPQTLYRFVKK